MKVRRREWSGEVERGLGVLERGEVGEAEGQGEDQGEQLERESKESCEEC